MGAVVAGVVGAVVGTGGLAIGRLVRKRDPVTPPCGVCDGPSRVRWEVVLAPVTCAACGRQVRAPTLVIVGTVALGLGVLRGLDGGWWLLPANAVLGGALAALTWTDIRYRVLPARLVWAAALVSLAALAIADLDQPRGRLPEAMLVALTAGGVFLPIT